MKSLFSLRPVTLRSLLAAGLLLCAGSIAAQTPPPRPNPDLRLKVAGEIHTVARHPDGGLVFGGNFSSVNGEPRENLARLRANGSLDPDWHPAADDSVQVVAVAPDGAVYVAGNFRQVGGQARSGLAKLSGTGAGDAVAAWTAQIDAGSSVYAMVADNSGLYAAGAQFTVTTTPPVQRRLTKLSSSTGAVDPTWNAAPNPGTSSAILTLALNGGGLYVGGSFSSIGGVLRSNAAKLVLDAGGNVVVDTAWNPAPDKFPYQFVLDGSAMYAVGLFDNIGGKARPNLAKIDTATGAAVIAWNPAAADSDINTVTVDSDGDVYIGGSFSSIGTTTRHRVAKLSGDDAAVVASWHPRFDGQFESISVAATIDAPNAAGDMLVVGGQFTRAEDELRLGLATIEASGALGKRTDAELPGDVIAVAAQSDGGLIVGGNFLTANGFALGDLVRVGADGMLDTGWIPEMGEGYVTAVAVDSRDDVYVGGRFDDGRTVDHLLKLSGSLGTRDRSWTSPPNNEVVSLALDANDNLYAGGPFDQVGSGPAAVSRDHVARFSPAGVLDSWSPQPGFVPTAIAVDGANNAVYLGGNFQLRKFATSDGALATNWNPSPANSVQALAVDRAGNVYAGGDFPMIGGLPRLGLAKLGGTGAGAADPTWNPASGVGTFVDALVLDGNGMLYVGGDFSELGGQTRANLARVSTANAGPADALWNPSVDNDVTSLAIAPDGAIAVAGRFLQIGGRPRDGLAVVDTRRSQTLSFGTNPGPFVFGGTAGAASATASSGLTVRYGTTTAGVCSVDAASGMITIVGAGDCIVTADQSGDIIYEPAAQITQTVRIDKADQAALTVTATPTDLGLGDTSALTATGGTTAAAVTYRITAGGTSCGLAGTTVTALAIGACTVEATRPGDNNYNDAVDTVQLRVSAVAGEHVFGDGFEH